MQLYKIASEYAQALEALEQMENVTPEMIEDSLVGMKDALETKVINVASYIKNVEFDIELLSEYATQTHLRIISLKKKKESLEKYLKHNLELASVKKVKGLEFDVSIRNNPKRVEIEDLSKLLIESSEYVKEEIKYNPDKKAIKEAIERGIEVPGARLEQTTSLVIK